MNKRKADTHSVFFQLASLFFLASLRFLIFFGQASGVTQAQRGPLIRPASSFGEGCVKCLHTKTTGAKTLIMFGAARTDQRAPRRHKGEGAAKRDGGEAA